MFSEWYESFSISEWVIVNRFYIVGAVILALLLYRYFRPQIKGFWGEQRIRIRLRRLNKDKYKVINGSLVAKEGESGPKSFIIHGLSFTIL